MEKKYYQPSIEEFHVGFECEYYNDFSEKWYPITIEKSNYDWDSWGAFSDDETHPFSNIAKFRVKYLDVEDIEDLGFKKTFKNQWIGWQDYYSGDVSGEYGYFLYVTLHFPRWYYEPKHLEDKFFKIIMHRYFVTNEDETTNIEDKINEGESEIVYKGVIKNKTELKKLLIQLGIV